MQQQKKTKIQFFYDLKKACDDVIKAHKRRDEKMLTLAFNRVQTVLGGMKDYE
ncbi:hypothetical protein [Bacillus suaedae]|uniref:Uncharacterized protein n=1 Tax=Halalkalibacter suaedae TaxID=2822140 RepID=A0A940X141_9BACI|nr:hypothetical protein [Bacillus suaedae]MBP3953616.1 hypothetical protein [Bacillus suaedae]